MRQRLSRVTIPLCCVCLSACGGGSNPTAPTVTATPVPAPVAAVLLQGSLTNMEAATLFTIGSFTTPGVGRLDVNVDWTFGTNNVDVYVARGTCTIDQVNQRTCPLATSSESTTAKPEKLVVASLDAGTYSLMIGNRGPTPEAASYQVILTR